MGLGECIRGEMEKGATLAQARKHCAITYESKATPGVRYRSAVPGMKTSPGRLEFEKRLLKKHRREQRLHKLGLG